MPRIFSGIQPSGELHIGNYLGAVKNWVQLQHDIESFICVGDYHAITIPYEPADLRRRTREMALSLLAAGIDPQKATLFVQSRVSEHTELAWIFNAITPLGELERQTQFKDKALALAALAAPPAPAPGPMVSLNGINIDGVTNQRFENCTVTIDGQGNVNIEAKGYTVRPASGPAPTLKAVPLAPAAAPPAAPAPASGPAPPAAPEKLTRRYFLVTEQTRPDGTQFDIAVFINAKWIRELKSQEDQVVAEVTHYLRPGPNKVTLAATKRQDPRKSTSPEVTFRVVIGEGDQGGDHVRIDTPLVDAKRTAAESGDVTEEFTLVAR